MTKYGVKHKVVIAYHPQSTGKPELSNGEIKRILKKVVNPSRKLKTPLGILLKHL